MLPVIYDLSSYSGLMARDSSLLASWPMFVEKKEVFDESGRSNMLSVINSASNTIVPYSGVILKGSHGQVKNTNIWNGMDAWTFSARIKLSKAAKTVSVFTIRRRDEEKDIVMSIHLDKGFLQVSSKKVAIMTSKKVLPTNTELAIAITYKAGKMYMYYGDIVESSVVTIGTAVPSRIADCDIFIGYDGKDSASYLNDMIGRIALNSRALSSEELLLWRLNSATTLTTTSLLVFPGSLTLARNDTPSGYVMSGTYVSPIMPLGEQTKSVSIAGYWYSGATVRIESRTSNDLASFSAWSPVGSDQEITSPAQKYIQLRVSLTTLNATDTPIINSIRLKALDTVDIISAKITEPRVYNTNGELVAVLNNLKSLRLSDENNGQELLKLSLLDAVTASELDNEYRIDLHYLNSDIPYNRFYIRDQDMSQGKGITSYSYEAEAEWYSLSRAKEVDSYSVENAYPRSALIRALRDTDWSVGFIEQGFIRCDMVIENKINPLAMIREIQSLWGGDIVFDNINKIVNYHRSPADYSFSVLRRKNMVSISRRKSTMNLVTRLVPQGKDGLTVEGVNGGKDYIEDFSWYTSRGQQPVLRTEVWTDLRFTKASNLLSRAKERLAQLSQPESSYKVDILNLVGQSFMDVDIPLLRAQAYVMDVGSEDLYRYLKVQSREMDLINPLASKIVLDNKIRDLGDGTSTAARLASPIKIGDTWFDGSNNIHLPNLNLSDYYTKIAIDEVVEGVYQAAEEAKAAGEEAKAAGEEALQAGHEASIAAAEALAAGRLAEQLAEAANSGATAADSKATEALLNADKANENALTAIADSGLALSTATGLQSTIGEISTTANKAAQDAEEAKKTANDLLGAVTENSATIVTLSKNVDTLTGEMVLKADKKEVDRVNNIVNAHTTSISLNTAAIKLKADQSEVNALSGTVNQHTAELTVQSNSISGLVTTTDQHTTQIGSIILEAGKLSSTISTVQNNMEHLGNGNLLPRTDFAIMGNTEITPWWYCDSVYGDMYLDNSVYDSMAGTPMYSAAKLICTTKTESGVVSFYGHRSLDVEGKPRDYTELKPNTTYTYSFWGFREQDCDSVSFRVWGYDDDGTNRKTHHLVNNIIPIPGKAQLFSTTFTTDHRIYYQLRIYTKYIPKSTGFRRLFLSDVQMTESAIRMAWAPSYWDRANVVQFSQLEQTATGIQASVVNLESSTSSQITILSNQVTSVVKGIENITNVGDNLWAEDFYDKNIGLLNPDGSITPNAYYRYTDKIPIGGATKLLRTVFSPASSATGMRFTYFDSSGKVLWVGPHHNTSVVGSTFEDIPVGATHVQAHGARKDTGLKMKIEFGDTPSPFTISPMDVGAQSQIIQLADQLTLEVSKINSGKVDKSQIVLLENQISLKVSSGEVATAIDKSKTYTDRAGKPSVPRNYPVLGLPVYESYLTQDLLLNGFPYSLSWGDQVHAITTNMNQDVIMQVVTTDRGRVFTRRSYRNFGQWREWAETPTEESIVSVINIAPEYIKIKSKLIHLAGNSLIDNAVIDTAHIVDLSVSEAKIAKLSVTNAKIGSLAVTESKIANLAVTNAKIDNLAVTSAKIANLAVTNAKIANLDAAKITVGTLTGIKISAVDIVGSNIDGGVITSASSRYKAVLQSANLRYFNTNNNEQMGMLTVYTSENVPKGMALAQTEGYSLTLTTSSMTDVNTLRAIFEIPKDSSFTKPRYVFRGNGDFFGNIYVSDDVKSDSVHTNNLNVTATGEFSSVRALYLRNKTNKSMQIDIAGNNSLLVSANSYSRIKVNADGLTVFGRTTSSSLNVSGSKNLIHVTRDGVRATPVYESPEDWLFDLGRATTNSQGLVRVEIDDLTYDIMNTDIDYLVELTEESFGQVIVREKHPRYFLVESSEPNLSFIWRINVKRRGYEKGRYREVVQSFAEMEEWSRPQ